MPADAAFARRERMGETVDALGYKADVPARAKESISEKAQSVKTKITGAGSQISDGTPDAQDVRRVGRQAVGVVQEPDATAQPRYTE